MVGEPFRLLEGNDEVFRADDLEGIAEFAGKKTGVVFDELEITDPYADDDGGDDDGGAWL